MLIDVLIYKQMQIDWKLNYNQLIFDLLRLELNRFTFKLQLFINQTSIYYQFISNYK